MNGGLISLKQYGINVDKVIRNATAPKLYEEALAHEPDAAISSDGALIVSSYEKTGRSPKDKRIVEHASIEKNVWWGNINIGMDADTFMITRGRAIDYLNTQSRIYVVDGFAGWDANYQIKVRIITTRPYHALFMHNMLIRPSNEQLDNFGEPDYVIFNAGQCSADPLTKHMTSKTSV